MQQNILKRQGGVVNMFIKSENQRYIVNYKYIDENNIYAKVFFIKDKNRIIEKNSIDGKYLVTAFYEKRVFIYNINNEGNYKLIKTKKYIDDVEIIDNNIYVIYVNGVIDIYSLEGVLIETKRNVNLIPLDICGEQYLIEDTYIKLADKIIKPIKFSLFMLWLIFFVTLRPNFCHRIYAIPQRAS